MEATKITMRLTVMIRTRLPHVEASVCDVMVEKPEGVFESQTIRDYRRDVALWVFFPHMYSIESICCI